ncbi:MAG TPA: hypothetical protein VH682_20315 [Gemmataceae bacterium]|jgi:hypothetical protein
MRTVLAIVLLTLPLLAVAQDKSAKEDKKPDEPAPLIVKAQLPRGWKTLGLTDKQRKEILTTRAKFAAKRQALEEQIKALKTDEMEALTKILTQGQRARLKELQSK